MKKLKRRLLYVLAYSRGEGLASRQHEFLSLPEIYWRCPAFAQSSVRTGLCELLEEGLVLKIIRGKRSVYRLTSLGHDRIFDLLEGFGAASAWDKCWKVVVLKQGSLDLGRVRRLSREMKKLKAVSWSRGVWLTPLAISEDIKRSIFGIGAAGAVVVFETKKWVLGDEKAMIFELWKLDQLEEKQKKLINQIQGLLTGVRSAKSLTDGAKDDFLVILDQWWGMMRGRPGLPKNLLPPEWQYDQAEKLVRRLCASVLELEREVRS